MSDLNSQSIPGAIADSVSDISAPAVGARQNTAPVAPPPPDAGPPAGSPSSTPPPAGVTSTTIPTVVETTATNTTNTSLRTSTSTSLIAPTSSGDGDSFSPAQVAGISIGTAIGGAILALAAAFLFIHFKQIPRKRRPSVASSVPMKPLSAPEHEHIVLEYLPPRMDDSTIQRKMDKLCKDIERCVDAFFNNPDLHLSSSDVTKLQNLGGSPARFLSWPTVLSKAETRKPVIRLLIAQALFVHIDIVSGTPDATLMPPHLLTMYQDLKKGEETMGQDGKRGPNSTERSEILSIWRQISGFFLPKDPLSQQSYLVATKIANELASLSPKPHERFVRILEGIVHDAGQLGLELFKSPDQWIPLWDSPQRNAPGNILVFPGLECVRKVFDGGRSRGTEDRFTLCSAVVTPTA